MHYQTKLILRETFSNLGTFIYNLFYFARRSQWDNDYAELRNLVLSLPGEVKQMYAEECAYLEKMPLENINQIMFPYPHVKNGDNDGLVIAKEKGCWYVLHNGAAKLFFPSRSATSLYPGLVYNEGLLGTGLLAKSPHCYQDDDFKIEPGDILLDVGCAEAILALDNIDKVAKAYLFECATEWRKPLRRTFAPYKDKVVFVDKMVSDKTKDNSTTLIDVVRSDISRSQTFFVKMDIEGGERTVLNGNSEFFKTAKVKLSCCVYHRQDDAQVIEAKLKEMGYKTRFSKGYMLPTINGIHYPYFRRGVIYAQNY